MPIHAAAAAGFATACASSSSRPLSTACRSLRPMLGMALAAAGLLTHGLTAAQEKSLETVVVTASGFEQEIKDAPASISVITREELEKGSYNNLHDALRDVPGVNLVPSDNNSNDISLRGMGVNYTLILVDGKRTNTRETQANGSTGTDQSWVPPLEAIERIEVVRGPMSSLYGSDAMGGVINIITRKVAKEWMGSIRTEATLQERSSSGNIYQSNFYLSGPIQTDLLGLSIYGNYNKRGEDNILNGYNDYDNRALNVKLALTPNKDHDIIAELGTGKQHYTSTPGKTLAATAALSDRQVRARQLLAAAQGPLGLGVLGHLSAAGEDAQSVARHDHQEHGVQQQLGDAAGGQPSADHGRELQRAGPDGHHHQHLAQCQPHQHQPQPVGRVCRGRMASAQGLCTDRRPALRP
jgi:outer membrane receptor for ferrienterochelin and colicins